MQRLTGNTGQMIDRLCFCCRTVKHFVAWEKPGYMKRNIRIYRCKPGRQAAHFFIRIIFTRDNQSCYFDMACKGGKQDCPLDILKISSKSPVIVYGESL